MHEGFSKDYPEDVWIEKSVWNSYEKEYFDKAHRIISIDDVTLNPWHVTGLGYIHAFGKLLTDHPKGVYVKILASSANRNENANRRGRITPANLSYTPHLNVLTSTPGAMPEKFVLGGFPWKRKGNMFYVYGNTDGSHVRELRSAYHRFPISFHFDNLTDYPEPEKIKDKIKWIREEVKNTQGFINSMYQLPVSMGKNIYRLKRN